MLRRSFKVGARSAFKFTLSEVSTVRISIARAETVPRLRRDPGYFMQQGFEFVVCDVT